VGLPSLRLRRAKRGRGTAFDNNLVIILRFMDKMIWGCIVSVLGILGLVAAVWMMNTGDVAKNLAVACIGGVLGTVAFFAGIRMMPDKSRL
jgi:hypothetical protein